MSENELLKELNDIARRMARARCFARDPDLAAASMRLCEVIVKQEARIAALESVQKTDVGQDEKVLMASEVICGCDRGKS